jgi:hypothetical protein
MDILNYKFYFEIINNKYTITMIFVLELLFCLLEFILDDVDGQLLIERL